jgi:hypothetical protein
MALAKRHLPAPCDGAKNVPEPATVRDQHPYGVPPAPEKRVTGPPKIDLTAHGKNSIANVKKRETYRTKFCQFSCRAKRFALLQNRKNSPGGLPVHFWRTLW